MTNFGPSSVFRKMCIVTLSSYGLLVQGIRRHLRTLKLKIHSLDLGLCLKL